MPDPDPAEHVLCACAVETHIEMSEEPFCAVIYRKNAATLSAHGSLCAPAQSKRTWTFHKSNFVWKFYIKMPHTTPPTSIKPRAFYTYHKNLFSVATLFGEKSKVGKIIGKELIIQP